VLDAAGLEASEDGGDDDSLVDTAVSVGGYGNLIVDKRR